jgi:hypothetical protein
MATIGKFSDRSSTTLTLLGQRREAEILPAFFGTGCLGCVHAADAEFTEL